MDHTQIVILTQQNKAQQIHVLISWNIFYVSFIACNSDEAILSAIYWGLIQGNSISVLLNTASFYVEKIMQHYR